MAFGSCPECGNTNHEESHHYRVRTFDCGFESQDSRRVSRCKGNAPLKPPIQYVMDDSASRYRLALLDASQALDVISGDMAAYGGENVYTQRCCELAMQMRALAGHDKPLAERAK